MFVYLKLIEEYYIYIMEISQILQEQKTEIKKEVLTLKERKTEN